MNLLIEILLDRNARIDERDDAAIDLASVHTKEALDALITIAKDPDEEDLWSQAGESIATIMYARNQIDWNILNSLMPSAKDSAKTYLESD